MIKRVRKVTVTVEYEDGTTNTLITGGGADFTVRAIREDRSMTRAFFEDDDFKVRARYIESLRMVLDRPTATADGTVFRILSGSGS